MFSSIHSHASVSTESRKYRRTGIRQTNTCVQIKMRTRSPLYYLSAAGRELRPCLLVEPLFIGNYRDFISGKPRPKDLLIRASVHEPLVTSRLGADDPGLNFSQCVMADGAQNGMLFEWTSAAEE